MKTTKLFILLISLLFLLSTDMNAQIKRKIEQVAGKAVKTKIWQGKEIQFVEREIAVKIIPSTTAMEINDLLNTVEGKIINSFDKLGWGLIELPAGKDELLAIDELMKLSFVSFAEPNMVTSAYLESNDPYYNGTSPATYPHQWALKNTGQTPPTGTNDADIDANDAWSISTGSSAIIIAILDSGIPMQSGSLSHPDLDDPNKIILGPDYVSDGNSVMDEYGHGTHVAGIAAAESDNGTGIAGVAWNSKIMVIQVFDAYGNGSWPYFYSGVVYAVDYQRNNPGEKVVINFSGGGSGASQQALDAVIYANTYGVPIVASVGNKPGNSVLYPAAYSSSYSNVIAVSSTDDTDTFSPFSIQGPQVSVSAPGGIGGYWDGNVYRYNGPLMLGKNIFSTTPNYTFNLAVDPIYAGDPYSTDVTQNYGYLPGTSMAAPHVSGIAALVLSINPNLTPSEVRTIIQQTAEDKGTTGFDNYYGWGRVNAYQALKYTLEHYGGTLTQSITIPSGETWTFDPGVTLKFANGSSLIVNGTLNAIGTPSNKIIFDRSGSNDWGGIVINSSSGSSSNITYAEIKNANYGLLINTASPTISNTKINYCGTGVQILSGGAPKFSNNTITYNDYNGVTCIAGVTASFGTFPTYGDNVIRRNGNLGIYAAYSSTVFLGQNTLPPSGGRNSIYENYNTNGYQISIRYGSTSMAEMNWWGSDPPDPNIFETSGGNDIDYDPWWTGSDPHAGRPLTKALALADNLTSSAGNDNVFSESGNSENQLWKAFIFFQKAEYDSAIQISKEIIKTAPSSQEAPSALNVLRLAYNESRKPGFQGYITSLIAQHSGKELAGVARLNLAYYLAKQRDFVAALGQLKENVDAFPNTPLERISLFQKAVFFLLELEDRASTEAVLAELERKYPGDPLVVETKRLLGQSIQQYSSQKQSEPGDIIDFVLLANYPNPFNPTTTISYSIPKGSFVTLTIYDVLGREVKTLVNKFQTKGKYNYTFNARNLTSGVYIYRIRAGDFAATKKLVLMK